MFKVPANLSEFASRLAHGRSSLPESAPAAGPGIHRRRLDFGNG